MLVITSHFGWSKGRIMRKGIMTAHNAVKIRGRERLKWRVRKIIPHSKSLLLLGTHQLPAMSV